MHARPLTLKYQSPRLVPFTRAHLQNQKIVKSISSSYHTPFRESEPSSKRTADCKNLEKRTERDCNEASHDAAELQPQTSRRTLLRALGLLAAIPLWGQQSQAAEGDIDFLEVENSVVGRFVELDSGWKRFETLDFQFDVPEGFTYVPAPVVATPAGRGRAAPPSPIKAGFKNKKGMQVTVMEYQSSQIKPTFFQLQDIKDLGSIEEVASLLAPTGVVFTNQEEQAVEQPVRDTGTVRGTVRAKPQTLYRFEYKLPTGVHVATAAVGRAGKVLLMGGTASDPVWQKSSDTLKRIVNSFQLTFPN